MTSLPTPLPARAGPAPSASTGAPRTGAAVPVPTRTHWASVQQPSSYRSTPRKLTEQQSGTWRHPGGGAGGPEAGWLSLEPLCPQITAVSVCNRILVFRWVLLAACSPVNEVGSLVGSSQDLARYPPSSPRADITSHLGNELPMVPRSHPGRANLSLPPPLFPRFLKPAAQQHAPPQESSCLY